MKVILATIASCFLASACTTYKPPDAPADQLARVKLDSKGEEFMEMRHTLFLQVDGARTGGRELTLLPGRHTVRILYRYQKSCADGELSFNAEPGREYIIRKNPIGSIETYGVGFAGPGSGPGSVARRVETSVEFWIDGVSPKVSFPVIYNSCGY